MGLADELHGLLCQTVHVPGKQGNPCGNVLALIEPVARNNVSDEDLKDLSVLALNYMFTQSMRKWWRLPNTRGNAEKSALWYKAKRIAKELDRRDAERTNGQHRADASASLPKR